MKILPIIKGKFHPGIGDGQDKSKREKKERSKIEKKISWLLFLS